MRKVLLILLCIPMLAFADDCADAYNAGNMLFKQGKYAAAQRKFIAVARECSGYSDVWEKIKSCTQKLEEEQSRQKGQIKSLTAENNEMKYTENQNYQPRQRSYSEGSNRAYSERTYGSEAVAALNTIREQRDKYRNQHAKDSIKILNLENQLKLKNDTIAGLRETKNNLSKQIEDSKKQIAESKKLTPNVDKLKEQIKELEGKITQRTNILKQKGKSDKQIDKDSDIKNYKTALINKNNALKAADEKAKSEAKKPVNR